MASRPSTFINWTDGVNTKVVQPPTSKQLQGWVAAEAPPFQYMNWLFYILDQWTQYLDQVIETGTGELGVRLINGGYWSWATGTPGTFGWTAAANLSIPGIPDSYNQIAIGSVTMDDGDVAYVTGNIPIFSTCNTQAGMNIITVNFPGSIVPGDAITGPGIPGGTIVNTVSGNQIVMSNNATATATGVVLTFCNTSALTVTTTPNDTFEPTNATFVLARRVGDLLYFGNNATEMTLRDGESKLLVSTGYMVYTATAGQNITENQAVYISAGGADGGRTAGAAYPCDAGAANGPTRYQFVGFALASALTGQPVTIVQAGQMGNFSSLIPGQTYWVNPSLPGGITATSPTGAHQWVIPVGIAISSTQLDINAALSATAGLFGGSGGGGGSAITWIEADNAPVPNISPIGLKTFAFSQGDGQALYATVKVPQSYLTGTQIFCYIDFYSPDSTGTAFMAAQTTLVRQGTDAISFTGNQYGSSNTAVTLSAGTIDVPQGVALDLTDASGNINSVQVNPGDLLLIKIYRGSDTGTSDLQVPDTSSLAI
jgi:hypothetical protein